MQLLAPVLLLLLAAASHEPVGSCVVLETRESSISSESKEIAKATATGLACKQAFFEAGRRTDAGTSYTVAKDCGAAEITTMGQWVNLASTALFAIPAATLHLWVRRGGEPDASMLVLAGMFAGMTVVADPVFGETTKSCELDRKHHVVTTMDDGVFAVGLAIGIGIVAALGYYDARPRRGNSFTAMEAV